MSSILTNRSAMTALSTLRSITTSLEEAQNRVATGLKVSKAIDNAAYWSISNNMKSDAALFGTVGDALALSTAQLDVAYNGASEALKILEEMRTVLFSARDKSANAERTALATEFTNLKSRLEAVTAASSVNRENWLYNTSTTAATAKTIVASIGRDSTGNTVTSTISLPLNTYVLADKGDANRGLFTKGVTVPEPNATFTATAPKTYFLLKINSTTAATGTPTPAEVTLTSTTAANTIDGMLAAVDAAIKSTTDVNTSLGSLTRTTTLTKEVIDGLKASFQKNIGMLVDADMNEESTRLKALQTQQQLSLQALSIANAESEKILILFR